MAEKYGLTHIQAFDLPNAYLARAIVAIMFPA
jgi:hypothetical protein